MIGMMARGRRFDAHPANRVDFACGGSKQMTVIGVIFGRGAHSDWLSIRRDAGNEA